ncbi:single-stranded-DNA-specific exonuclease RecJ [Pseudohaliea rubra]|uniref:single-stranded-DNA-specific exonuclease RecJ n=1 Tax=Pseudohaliea rubra TaxID=475795 RepID=UPI00068C2E7C|nr:single-stranded-DNA-specific exonuclease RecJ [Pseudohaliea rubra]
MAAAGLHPVLARAYAARGVLDPDELDLSLGRLLPPDALLGADRAAARLAQALATDERILFVGDFDADGATSCALGVRALRAFGAAHVDFLVPNRFEYGYGLSPEIVALAAEGRPDLLVTVDNGIASLAGVAAARQRGMDVIVTDHHLPGDELPAATVIVNPNQRDCAFPSKHLAGVGVVFYLLLALRRQLRDDGWFTARGVAEPRLADFLDLVALGTVADVVPLDRNNRILVQGGLARIRAGRASPGVAALLAVAGRDPRRVVASDLGFAVGPRLNAAGRLDDMTIGIECLLSDDPGAAHGLAARLDQFNRDRRLIEQDMQTDALALLAAREDDLVEPPLALALYEPGWHQGVIGILASRIKDRVHRPVIAFADAEADGAMLKGSARSIPGVHIRDVLANLDNRHPGLIDRFGGHAMAAGLSLPRQHLDAFAAALVEEVARQAQDVELQAVLESDGELAPAELALELASSLRNAGPWGQHFPEPLFDGRFVVKSQRIVGERHLKLVLAPAGAPERAVDAIAFNIDPEAWPDPSVVTLAIAYRLDVNAWRGEERVQLIVEHLTPVP